MIKAIFIFILGLWLGNILADQATLRDCATADTTILTGGGSIQCRVVKQPVLEQKPISRKPTT